MRFAAFFDLYKICTLSHRSKDNISVLSINYLQPISNFCEIQEKIACGRKKNVVIFPKSVNPADILKNSESHLNTLTPIDF